MPIRQIQKNKKIPAELTKLGNINDCNNFCVSGGTIMNMMSKQSFAKKDLLDDKTIVLTKSSLHVESQQTQVNNVVEKLKRKYLSHHLSYCIFISVSVNCGTREQTSDAGGF